MTSVKNYKPGQLITVKLPHSDTKLLCRVLHRSKPGRRLFLIPMRIALRIPLYCKLVLVRVLREYPTV